MKRTQEELKIIIDMLKVDKMVQKMIDKEARSLGFDNINSISKFLGFANKYEADAISLRNWCALMWETTEASTATTIEALELELPARV